MRPKKRNLSPGAGAEKSPAKTDLRTAPPVQRMRLVLGKLFRDVGPHLAKLGGWVGKNQSARRAHTVLLKIASLARVFDAEMSVFEETGWSPARRSYTAKTRVGDRVAILDDMRPSYAGLMDPGLMGDLRVVHKHEGNKGGGLDVQAADGVKMKVSISHVVKLSLRVADPGALARESP
jgi:hypothetical protein